MCAQTLLRVFVLVGGTLGSDPKKISKRKGGMELVYPMPLVCARVERTALLLTSLSPKRAESSLAW